MKQLLVIALSLVSLHSSSQSSLDSTTTWTYSFNDFGIIVPKSLFINGDTIINGITWLKLDGDASCAFTNPASLPLIREIDDKWVIYDINRDIESILYDFSLKTGDSYSIEIYGPNFPEIIIDSISTRLINGVERTVQHIDIIDFGSEIIEGIGSTDYLFPQGNICDPHTGPLRCFQNTTEFVDLDPDRACDVRYLRTNTDDIINELDINIYPNPTTTNSQVFVESEYQFDKIEVTNYIGEIIQTYTTNTFLEFNKSGLYYLRMWIDEQIVVKNIVIINE